MVIGIAMVIAAVNNGYSQLKLFVAYVDVFLYTLLVRCHVLPSKMPGHE